MKKSIAVLSILVLMSVPPSRVFQKQQLSVSRSSIAILLPESISAQSVVSFAVNEDGEKPWKDPWQWLRIFRDLWVL